LLAAAARNQNRGAESVRLFEIGRRYLADGEHVTAGVVLAGSRASRHWQTGKAQPFDAFDAKAEALALLAAAGVTVESLQLSGEAGAHYHPGQSGILRLGPKAMLASFGALHPATAKAFEVEGAVVACEVYLDACPAKRGSSLTRAVFSPPPLQAVTRDFAFLVPETVASATLVRTIKGADKTRITGARLFDRFVGAGVPERQVSLAVEVTFQPSDKSFTEADLRAVSDKIVTCAAKLGAVLRG
jgi:phenylalanyl-tRNA synthetase beta chain